MSMDGRYAVEAAPGGLSLVQRFLNTAATANAKYPDLLADREAVSRWMASVDELQTATVAVTHANVVLLRQLRAQVRGALIARDHPAGTDEIVLGVADLPATARIADDGVVALAPALDGAAGAATAVLLRAYEAQLTGEWRRLKVCRNAACRVAFYDRSRNTSAVWHDVHTCGNSANLRASRARRRPSGRSDG
ncbi:CGNR zinc finger domain-containing protein [Kribbella sp. NPDC000426]|uniref:CGNR zinc finger domain-containing protein n=1 Tax=Kribbella sp. NPDC000426 TaxID=3154255 RepID=UPI00332E712D